MKTRAKIIEEALQPIIDKALSQQTHKIFNAKKGDKVYIPMKDGTEQIWQCIKIQKLTK